MTLKYIAFAGLLICLQGCLSVDGNQRADKVGNTVVGQSMARAKDEVCMANLRQIRQAVAAYMTSDETPPSDMSVLKLPPEMLADPIGKEPYEYDPATGKVKCLHPGHGKY